MDWYDNTSTQSTILPPDATCRGDIDLFSNSCSIDPTEVRLCTCVRVGMIRFQCSVVCSYS